MSAYKFREQISSTLVMSDNDVSRLIIRAPHSYKVYSIDKKDGGQRVIAQPAKETKYIQQLLIAQIFSRLPIHQCATAYKNGASIKKNAEQHKSNKYVSKFDFVNFFGSIKYRDIISHLASIFPTELSEETLKDISRVCCIKHKGQDELCLSIGAPSSPILSNSIMYEFDKAIYEWSVANGLTFSRYADDLTFSSNNKGLFTEIEPFILQTLRNIRFPKLELNTKKTIHVSMKHQRRVTGLVLNNDGQVSLGRERKRLISAMIHHYTTGTLSEKDTMHLQGLLGFAEDAEPQFVFRMKCKYGIVVISDLFQKRGKKIQH